MKNLIIAILLSFSSLALAHPGSGEHTHAQPEAITQAEAQARARKLVEAKVSQGKLTEKWLDRPPTKTYESSFGHGPEWVVEFHDPKATDKKKRVLYVYMTVSGKSLGVNFTGH